MLSQDLKYRLGVMLTDDEVANQVALRLISSTPADAAAAQAVLDTLDTSKKMEDSIAERLFDDMAGSGAQGNELSRKINGMVHVLQAQANGEEVPAAAATFSGQVAGMTTDVTIDADTAGAAGNSIALVFDGLKDIDTVISDWNTANPLNTASLSSGDGSQIPDNLEEIDLSGGSDQHDADLAPALAAMGSEPMSASAYESLILALSDVSLAAEFKAAYNAMIVAVQAIT